MNIYFSSNSMQDLATGSGGLAFQRITIDTSSDSSFTITNQVNDFIPQSVKISNMSNGTFVFSSQKGEGAIYYILPAQTKVLTITGFADDNYILSNVNNTTASGLISLEFFNYPQGYYSEPVEVYVSSAQSNTQSVSVVNTPLPVAVQNSYEPTYTEYLVSNLKANTIFYTFVSNASYTNTYSLTCFQKMNIYFQPATGISATISNATGSASIFTNMELLNASSYTITVVSLTQSTPATAYLVVSFV